MKWQGVSQHFKFKVAYPIIVFLFMPEVTVIVFAITELLPCYDYAIGLQPFFQSLEAAVTEVVFPTRWRGWPMLHHRVHNAHERAVNLRVDCQRSQWVPSPTHCTSMRPLTQTARLIVSLHINDQFQFKSLRKQLMCPTFLSFWDFKSSHRMSHLQYKRCGGGGNIMRVCVTEASGRVFVCACLCVRGFTFVIHEGPTSLN